MGVSFFKWMGIRMAQPNNTTIEKHYWAETWKMWSTFQMMISITRAPDM